MTGPGSTAELDLTETGTIDLRAATQTKSSARVVVADDRRFMRLSLLGSQVGTTISEADCAVVEAGFRTARDQGLPVIGHLSAAGPNIAEGLAPSVAWSRIAREMVRSSGIVPILFVADGPVLSGPSFLLGLADVVVFTTDAYAYLSGPRMVRDFTGTEISGPELGGAGAHQRSSGLAAAVVETPAEGEDYLLEVLSYLPNHVDELSPVLPSEDPLDRPTPEAGEFLPDTPTGSYDVRDIISSVADDGHFTELRAQWAPNIVVGFASMGGHPIGIVANQTQSMAGSIDIAASQKGARFVGFCDAFNIPLLTIVDTSGFLPGKDLEWRGMIRHGAQLAFAYARATVPRIGLIVRKSYGGAYIVMDSVNMGNDVMFAWPTAEVAVMGAKGAVEILHRGASEAEKAELVAEYESTYLTPYPAAERGSITAVIEPEQTRRKVIAALQMLSSKREKLRPRRHDNMPL
ncbi:MAG: acyl-CoA carboxylase subunit beta [Acidimicrobiales bacterium]